MIDAYKDVNGCFSILKDCEALTHYKNRRTVGIWNATIWNPDFLKVTFQMVGL